jgi:L-alanine-DL-glutamate epimerase-like enolase superfamily enzyme
MKIRSVDATWLRVPIPEERQHTSDFGRMRSFDTVLVRIETEGGLVGHGEAKAGVGNLGDGRALVALIGEELGERLIGRDARRIAGHWEAMYNGSRARFAIERGHVFPALGRRGLTISAISGIDIALWDILGQSLGVPVWQLFWAANAGTAWRPMPPVAGRPPMVLANSWPAILKRAASPP